MADIVTEMKKFIDRLADEKGLNGLDDEVLEQIKKDLLDRLEDRINVAILEHMPAEQLGEFEALLDRQAGEDEVQQFCAKHIANLDEVVAAAMLRFRQVYLNG